MPAISVDPPPRAARRARLAYHVFTWWCRGYLTFVLAVLAVLGAERRGVAAAMVGGGVALDLVRSRIAKDFRLSAWELEARVVASSITDPTVAAWRRRSLGLWLAASVLPAGYLLTLLVVDTALGSGGPRSYFAAFAPLHDLAAATLAVARRHAAELDAAGFADRAPLVTHIYAVTVLAQLATAFLFISEYTPGADVLLPRTPGHRRRDLFGFVLTLLLFVLGMAILLGIQEIDWDPTGKQGEICGTYIYPTGHSSVSYCSLAWALAEYFSSIIPVLPAFDFGFLQPVEWH